MMKEIYASLGLSTTVELEQKKFVQRSAQLLEKLQSDLGNGCSDVFRRLSFALGEPGNPSLSWWVRNNSIEKCILVLQIILDILREDYGLHYEDIADSLSKAMEYSVLDLGYHFTDGKFTRAGTEELDKTLILETLTWLKDVPQARLLYENSLRLLLNKNLMDAVTNAYSTLESLVKTALSKDKSLDSDEIRRELVRFTGLGEEWGQMLHWYCKTAHEFSSRHGQRECNGPETELTYELAEFYVYMTGTFIRLIIQRTRA